MPRPKGDIEDRILAAARDRFIHDGVDGASLRHIARAAGTSIGMIYYYFPTKDDLFFGVVEQVYVELLKDLGTALGNDVPVETRLERLYARITAVSEDELQVLRLVAREALVSSSRRERLIERFKRGHVPMVLAALADGYADGTIRSDIHPMVAFFATFAVGVVPQFAYRVAAGKLPFFNLPAPNDYAKQLLDVLFHGIGSPKTKPPAAGRRSAQGGEERSPAARPHRSTNPKRGA